MLFDALKIIGLFCLKYIFVDVLVEAVRYAIHALWYNQFRGTLIKLHKNKVLYFEVDRPFMKNYFVDYLDASPLWEDVQTNIENIFTSESADKGSSGESSASSASVTPNKTAGILTVYANQKQCVCRHRRGVGFGRRHRPFAGSAWRQSGDRGHAR